MDQAGQNHWKALLRVINYCETTKNHVLQVFNKTVGGGAVVLEAFSDSDYAVDKETRRSVTGYVIFLDGSPDYWRSKGQKTVTLSTKEAEYVALREATRELKFIYQVLSIMGVKVELPIKVNVENVGTIFLSQNRAASDRTKHVDTRYHFVRDMIKTNLVKVFFVPSEMNVADIFTKNLDSQHFAELQQKLKVHPRHRKGRVLKTEFDLKEEKDIICR
jgi:hypothetical protein